LEVTLPFQPVNNTIKTLKCKAQVPVATIEIERGDSITERVAGSIVSKIK
jgi:hypothetical protein